MISANRGARLVGPLGSAAAVLAAWGLVAIVDPNQPGRYPVCPLLATTGLACPACGGLRAAHALADGDLALAADLNVMFVLALPVVVALWGRWTYVRARGSDAALLAPVPASMWPVLLAVAAGFAVLRNLPWAGLPWLAP